MIHPLESDRPGEALPLASGEVRLADLERGGRGVVVCLDAGAAIARRLQDLGFLPGTEVRVERRAPLGDPVVYELRGYRLCLRRSEAAHVRVRPLPARGEP